MADSCGGVGDDGRVDRNYFTDGDRSGDGDDGGNTRRLQDAAHHLEAALELNGTDPSVSAEAPEAAGAAAYNAACAASVLQQGPTVLR